MSIARKLYQHKYSLILLLFISTLLLSACGSNEQDSDTLRGLGIYQQPPTKKTLKSIKKLTGKKPGIIAWTQNWEYPFPTRRVTHLKQQKIIPLIIWEPWVWDDPIALQPSNIITGEWDDYIQKYAQAIKDHEGPIILVVGSDIAGDQKPWQIGGSKEKSDLYRKMIGYIQGIFKEIGVENAYWSLAIDHTDIKTITLTESNFQDLQLDYIATDAPNGLNENQTEKLKAKFPTKKLIYYNVSTATESLPNIALFDVLLLQQEDSASAVIKL